MITIPLTKRKTLWTKYQFTILLILIFLTTLPETLDAESSEDEDLARSYSTPEERREAGIKHQITDWLLFSGLLEIETEHKIQHLQESSNTPDSSNFTKSLQAAFELSFAPWNTFEIIVEYDDELDKVILDEAVIKLEYKVIEFEAGKIYLPFGEYFSFFVSSPVLEFSETRDSGALLTYSVNDKLDFTAAIYKGHARKIKNNPVDWNIAIEFKPSKSAIFGLGYLSDLADSQENLLADTNNRYGDRVDAVNAWGSMHNETFNLTLEYTAALQEFTELERHANKPEAWNIELAWFASHNTHWALRLEGSQEVNDAHDLQAGLAFGWRMNQYTYLTLEYLRGRYKQGFSETDNEESIENTDTFGAQLTIEF